MKVFLLLRQFTLGDGTVVPMVIGMTETEDEAVKACTELDLEFRRSLTNSLIRKTVTGPIDMDMKVNQFLAVKLGITNVGHGYVQQETLSPIAKVEPRLVVPN